MPESGEALAIDPLDHRKCLAAARDRAMIEATHARLLAEVAGQDPANPLVTTLALEKEINTFSACTARVVTADRDTPELSFAHLPAHARAA